MTIGWPVRQLGRALVNGSRCGAGYGLRPRATCGKDRRPLAAP